MPIKPDPCRGGRTLQSLYQEVQGLGSSSANSILAWPRKVPLGSLVVALLAASIALSAAVTLNTIQPSTTPNTPVDDHAVACSRVLDGYRPDAMGGLDGGLCCGPGQVRCQPAPQALVVRPRARGQGVRIRHDTERRGKCSQSRSRPRSTPGKSLRA